MTYRIIAKCDPYNARSHYRRGQEVIRYNGPTPVEWVMEDNLELEEALSILNCYAAQLSDNVVYFNEDFIKEFPEDTDFSWYKGPGWYENEEPVYLEGQRYLSYDVMAYDIEEI